MSKIKHISPSCPHSYTHCRTALLYTKILRACLDFSLVASNFILDHQIMALLGSLQKQFYYQPFCSKLSLKRKQLKGSFGNFRFQFVKYIPILPMMTVLLLGGWVKLIVIHVVGQMVGVPRSMVHKVGCNFYCNHNASSQIWLQQASVTVCWVFIFW